MYMKRATFLITHREGRKKKRINLNKNQLKMLEKKKAYELK